MLPDDEFPNIVVADAVATGFGVAPNNGVVILVGGIPKFGFDGGKPLLVVFVDTKLVPSVFGAAL